MAKLKLFTFGPPRLERDGRPIDFNLRRALALLIYLSVTAQPQSRDTLATLLWPESDQREARGRLRRTLHRLREEVGFDVVAVSADTISLHPNADLWLDCIDFLNHAARGLEKQGRPDLLPEQTEHLRTAAALYSDDFLAGWTGAESAAFDDWQFFERERLRQLLAQVLENLVRSNGAQGLWEAAIPYARRWVALDPLHETAQQQLMSVYASAGQHAAAIRQYQECARILEAELGVAPDEATTALYDAIRFRRFSPQDNRAPSSNPQSTASSSQAGAEARPHAMASFGHSDGSALFRLNRQITSTVGREAELQRLQEHLAHALNGKRQIVFVAGEPGIGKTTLVNLFLDSMRDSVWIGRGQCLEHRGAGEAFGPLLEALGRLCRGPNASHVIGLLIEHAPSWLVQLPGHVSSEQLTILQPKVLGTTRERMLREFVELLNQFTAQQPLVLVLEDLHWSDYSTLDALAMVARQHDPARLLVVGTYRPADAQTNRHALHEVARELRLRSYASGLDLALLSKVAVERYLQARFDAALFPDGLAALLHKRTDGNPLFMVTVVDSWIDDGFLEKVDERWAFKAALDELTVGVPETLSQLIELQIERLEANDQSMLEAASVAGDTFSAAEVAAAIEQEVEEVESRCTALARHWHFLREREADEWPDGTIAAQFEWSHHVVRQVLYERVTATRRARLHCRIGLRLEAGYGDTAPAMAPKLAAHFVQGRNRQRAVRYLALAAEQALNRSAYREAIDLIKLGLGLLDYFADARERNEHELALQAMLAPALIATQGWGSAEAEQAYHRAEALSAEYGSSRQRDHILFGLASMLEYRAEYQKSSTILHRQLNIEHGADRELVVESHDMLACSLFHQGAFTGAVEQARQGLSLYDPQQQYALIARFGENPGVGFHIWSALSLWFLGYPDQALTWARLAVQQAQNHLYGLAHAQAQLACIHQLRHEVDLTHHYAGLTIEVATPQGFPYRVAVGKMLQGWTRAVQGHAKDGVGRLREGLDACLSMGVMVNYPYFLALLADACRRAGEVDEGLIALAGAQAIVLNSRSFYYEAELHRLKGSLLLRASRKANVDDAEACFAEALAVARRQGAKSLELRAAMSLGRLWQVQGKQAEAYRIVSETSSWFTEGFDTLDLQQARAFLQKIEREDQVASSL